MKNHSQYIAILLMLVIGFAACDTHQKVMKSTNNDYKYEKALEYYYKGDYYKAAPIFEELMSVYRVTEKAEELYYLYANCQFEQRQYVMAAYHFKRFHDQYPLSQYAEESLYKHADAYYKMTAKSKLDQTFTEEAMDAFQFFINSYPLSERVQDANVIMDKLRRKLEIKALNNANLYYKTGSYRAAAVEYKNVLSDFPDVEEHEHCLYMIVRSYYDFAEKSISSKKSERFEQVIESYKDYAYRYPNGAYIGAVESYYERARFKAIYSAYEYAQVARLKNRMEAINTAGDVYDKHLGYVNTEKYSAQLENIKEHLQLLVIKTHYQLAQDNTGLKRKDQLQKAVSAYYEFVDKYENSRYFKEVERIFVASRENLNKINGDGENQEAQK